MQRQLRSFLLIFAGLVLLAAGTLFFIGRHYLVPFGTDHQPVELVIEPGMTLPQIADTLERQQVIRSARLLRLWMRYRKTERSIKTGLVVAGRGDGIINASVKLLQARPIEISIMIPEGLTIEQTARHIMRTMPIDTARFINLCYDSAFIRECGLNAPSLEGYLFPDTYRMPEAAEAANMIRRMTACHLQAWVTIDKSNSATEKYSHHQLVTLASIVEREATLISEQPRISGVFHNRLRLGYPLGADPTVRFALKKFGGPLRVSELNSPSPYNTRRFPGLPPGPICSPGKGALAAAVLPLDTKDLYFVALWDGSGAHDFSVTNAEHDRKKHLIRKRNAERLQRKGASGK